MNTKLSAIDNKPSENTSKYLTPLGVWALSFGGIIGWGSFVMPGTMFLPNAGPLGTILAMILGGLIMLVIGANFCTMTQKYQDNGGIFAYTRNILGNDHAFLAAWSLGLAYLSLIWANATAFVLIIRYLFGDILQIGFHYQIAGYDVFLGEILVTWLVIIAFGLLSCYGGSLARKLHIIFALTLLISVTALFIGIFAASDTISLSPAFQENVSPSMQVFSMLMLAPWMFFGFEAVCHASEEFSFSPSKLYPIIVAAVASGVLVYCLLNTIAVMKIPAEYSSWIDYVADLKNLSGFSSMPVFHSVWSAFSSFGIWILGLAVLSALSTSLLGFYRASAYLFKAMANDKLMPEFISETSSDGTPRKALLIIMAMSLAVPFLGRTAIVWLTDVTTISASIAYGYVSLCSYLAAKESEDNFKKFLGITGVVASVCFFFFPILPNLLLGSSLTTESYLLLAIWSIVGFIYYWYVFKHDYLNRFGKSMVMCIMILFLNFFSTSMWMRQVTEDQVLFVLGTVNDFIGETLTFHTMMHMGMITVILFLMANIFTTMRQREKTLTLQIVQEQERSRAKTNFLSNMSHDIRTPMNAIIGYLEIAKKLHKLCENCTRPRCPDEVPEKLYDFMSKIETSSRHLLSLINDVLEMSRIENGKMELDESENNIVKLVNEVGEMFDAQMQTKDINFVIDTKVKNPFVICDKNRLNRILLNLLSNAYKFTPQGGKVSITLTQSEGTREGFGNYELRVKDSGIGMSEEFAKEIFEPFTRERTSTVSGIQGTGLGMAITKNFTDLMGGKIAVETEKGIGTEFILNLQLSIVDKQEELSETAKAEQNQPLDFSTKKLLLVEDIEVNREIANMILTQVGFTVDMAVNGKEAVEKIKASKPGDFDAILMDIQMPVMNGYEAAKAIRALENPKLASIPIVAMTANAFEEDIQNAKAAGMNDHIAKPIDVAKMMATLTKVLQS